MISIKSRNDTVRSGVRLAASVSHKFGMFECTKVCFTTIRANSCSYQSVSRSYRTYLFLTPPPPLYSSCWHWMSYPARVWRWAFQSISHDSSKKGGLWCVREKCLCSEAIVDESETYLSAVDESGDDGLCDSIVAFEAWAHLLTTTFLLDYWCATR